jgi:hypothetical protein
VRVQRGPGSGPKIEGVKAAISLPVDLRSRAFYPCVMPKILRNPELLIATGCVVLLAIFAITLWPVLHPTPKVVVLDPRFHVLTVNWSSGTNHVLYEGNPLEGRLRNWLFRMGLRVRLIPSNRFHTDGCSRGILVRYSGDFEHGELEDITAELINARNQPMPLRSIVQEEDKTKKEFAQVWVLDPSMTNSGPALRIKLRTKSVDLAEIVGSKS